MKNEKEKKFFIAYADQDEDTVLIDKDNKKELITDNYKYIRNIREALKIFDLNDISGLALCQVIDETHHNEIISK